ncbi:MAG: FtsX-like permease family protein [FCB group bacterium]|nr:FtsX-like permease family protein [FCB group bacterium]
MLVIFEFGVSVLLLISSVFIFKRMDFMNTKELGFSKDQVLILPHPGQQMDVMKSKLQERSDVKSSSATSAVPGERFIVLSVRVPDLAGTGSTEELEDDGSRGLRVLCADEDIVQTLGLEILDGRPFSLEFGTDSSSAFILNEAAVLDLGLEDPVGKAFEYTYNLPEPKAGQIVGIVKDFHYASLHTEVDPLMIQIFPPYYRNLMVKLDTSDIQTSIADIQALWNQVVPNVPFDYSFLDTSYDQMYKSELNLKKIVSFFTLLAILVAALGLSGLTSYSTEQRRKEIAIRKVLGASAINIFKNLSGEFVLLVIAANIIAWIPAWFFMKNWLQEFAFQIDLTAWPFLLILIAVLMLTLLMIVGSSYRNIHANPVKSLHYE